MALNKGWRARTQHLHIVLLSCSIGQLACEATTRSLFPPVNPRFCQSTLICLVFRALEIGCHEIELLCEKFCWTFICLFCCKAGIRWVCRGRLITGIDMYTLSCRSLATECLLGYKRSSVCDRKLCIVRDFLSVVWIADLPQDWRVIFKTSQSNEDFWKLSLKTYISDLSTGVVVASCAAAGSIRHSGTSSGLFF